LGAPLAFAAVAGFITLQALGGRQLFWQPATQWVPPFFSAHDYVVGALVALLIVGLANARLPMPGAALERLIHGLAGTAFGLYLLHYPLLNFLGTVIPGPADGAMHRILVFGLTLGASIGLAHLIERQKGALKLALRSGVDRVRGRRRDSALRKRTAP
jgi:peptidoglycan/LPS O-acetylase OafA/YrhL